MAVHLVLGGARSGKSRYAEQQALAQADPLHYIATAEAGDREMAERIRRHRSQRSDRFATHECPRDLAGELRTLDQSGRTVLVDCLTLWLGNWVEADADDWQHQRQALLDQVTHTRAELILVSNEVGQGVVPMGALNRRFVDEAGWLHQDIAQRADRVTFVVAGLPQRLK